jgi:23S rRNA pseudouridine1911/1915/1917 synthase
MASLSRPALHARTLAFDHPATGERLSFEAGVPEDMQQALETLEGTGWA